MAEIPVPDSLLAALAAALVDPLADAVADRLAARETTTERVREVGGRLALTKAEAAEALGISADSLRRHVLGEIRMVRIGGKGGLRLIPVAELEAWIERHAARLLEGER